MEMVVATASSTHVEFHDPYPHDELLKYFSFYPEGYKFMPLYRNRQWDGRIRFLKRDRVPLGLFRALRSQIEEELELKFAVMSSASAGRRFTFNRDGVWSNRIYQNECSIAMERACQAGGGLVLNATGSGKTRIVGMLLSRLVGTACFVVDELTLLKQAREELENTLKEKVGEVGDQKFVPQRTTVATVQTMYLHRADRRFAEWIRSLDLLVIDEVHQMMNKSNFAVVKAVKPFATLGLTATLELKRKPVRTQAYALCGPVVYEYPLERGVEEGYLAKGVAVQILHTRVDAQPRTGPGAFVKDYTEFIVNDAGRNRLICSLAREAHGRGYYVIVLVERIKHLELIANQLSDVMHRVAFGDVAVSERIRAKQKFEVGEVRLLIANKVFKKGVDIKRVDVIIDAAAGKSQNDTVQKFGRGVRLHEEKQGLLYFDIGDVGNRFIKATRSRKSALKKSGIPTVQLIWGGPQGAVDEAETLLQQATSKPVPA